MAWFGGKVSLGRFPVLAEAVNKIQESVKTIEKNFDNALGIEEKLESSSDEVHFHGKTIAGEDKEAVQLEKDNEHPEAWEKADTAITDPAEVESESESGLAKLSKSSFQDVNSSRSPDDEKPKENPDVVPSQEFDSKEVELDAAEVDHVEDVEPVQVESSDVAHETKDEQTTQTEGILEKGSPAKSEESGDIQAGAGGECDELMPLSLQSISVEETNSAQEFLLPAVLPSLSFSNWTASLSSPAIVFS